MFKSIVLATFIVLFISGCCGRGYFNHNYMAYNSSEQLFENDIKVN